MKPLARTRTAVLTLALFCGLAPSLSYGDGAAQGPEGDGGEMVSPALSAGSLSAIKDFANSDSIDLTALDRVLPDVLNLRPNDKADERDRAMEPELSPGEKLVARTMLLRVLASPEVSRTMTTGRARFFTKQYRKSLSQLSPDLASRLNHKALNLKMTQMAASLIQGARKPEAVEPDWSSPRTRAKEARLKPSRPVEDKKLLQSVKLGDLAGVKKALKHGANVNAQDLHGFTALMSAAGQGHSGIVDFLLDQDIRVNYHDRHGWTALMRAVSKGHAGIAKLLIEKGKADVNVKASGNWTALMVAAMESKDGSSHRDSAAILLAHHADIHARNVSGETALDIALRLDHKDIRDLIEKEAAPARPLGEESTARLSPLPGSAPGSLEAHAAHNAKAHLDALVKRKIPLQVKTGFNGWLNQALWKALQEPISEVSAPLKRSWSVTEIKLLLELGADVDTKDSSDGKTSYGMTPLMLAASYNQPDLAEIFLAHGADPNAKDVFGDNALMRAAITSPSVAKLLIAKTRDLTARSEQNGLTAAENAREHHHQDVAELIEKEIARRKNGGKS